MKTLKIKNENSPLCGRTVPLPKGVRGMSVAYKSSPLWLACAWQQRGVDRSKRPASIKNERDGVIPPCAPGRRALGDLVRAKASSRHCEEAAGPARRPTKRSHQTRGTPTPAYLILASVRICAPLRLNCPNLSKIPIFRINLPSLNIYNHTHPLWL